MRTALLVLVALGGLALGAFALGSCSVNDYCINCGTGDGGGSGGDDGGLDGGDADSGLDGGCVPTGPEECDGKDNDCNGLTDDGTLPGVGVPCTNQVGACAGGIQQCTSGALECNKKPSPEICDMIDNNCSGAADEGDPGGGGLCGTNLGECVAGVEHCNPATGIVECQGFQDHTADPELCDGKDNDCDGNFDESVVISPGSCGPTTGDGECTIGTLMCQGGSPVCMGAVFPKFETCNNLDDDCDNATDEIFNKQTDPNNCMTCGTVCPSPSKTCRDSSNVGTSCTMDAECPGGTCVDNSLRQCVAGGCTFACKPGFHNLDGMAANGCEYPCFASGVEECDGVDNNCNGMTDEGLTPPAICKSGGECGAMAPAATCGGAAGWSCSYSGMVQFPETRCDTLDNDCDLNVDEGQPNLGQACDNGLQGVCRGTGAFACDTSDLNGPAVCVITAPGQPSPDPAETCNDKDDDCDGGVDEGAETGNLLGQEWVAIGGGRQIMKYEAAKFDATNLQQGTKTSAVVGPIVASPTGATQAGATATFTTTAPHGLAVGMNVRVSGVADSGYNGLWTVVTVPSTTTFTANLSVTGLPASGGGSVSRYHGSCSKAGTLPWTNVTYPEAQAVCASMGASLCSETRWHQACGVVAPTAYPITADGTNGTRIEAEDFSSIAAGAGGPEVACNDAVDDDLDGLVNDGCPAVITGAETGNQCNNNTDDDFDGRDNDGCPAVGPPETGAQCNNNSDNDGDGRDNDGCPAVFTAGESGSQCTNATDNDADGLVNDGCPASGALAWVEDYTPAPQAHSGIANMRAVPNLGASITTGGAVARSPRLDYQIDFTAAADWRVWVRMYSATGADNTVHVGVGGTLTPPAAPTMTLATTANGTWQWVQSPAINIATPGVQFVSLFMAEDGMKVDAIFVVRGGTTPPAAINPAGGNWSYATNPTTYQATTCNGTDFSAVNDNVLPTGSAPMCYADHASTNDVFDMSGNVKEWTLARQPGENPIRGGASNDLATGISCPLNFTLANDAFFFPNVGFRCCR